MEFGNGSGAVFRLKKRGGVEFQPRGGEESGTTEV